MKTVAIAIVLAELLAGASPAAAAGPFQLARADGDGWVSPGHLDDKPAVLLFWDSRCPGCIVELANVAMLQKQYPEAVFVTVSLSSPPESQRVLSRIKLPEAVTRARAPINPTGLLAALGNSSGALPFTAAFDPAGRLCASFGGRLVPDRMAMFRARCAGVAVSPAPNAALPPRDKL